MNTERDSQPSPARQASSSAWPIKTFKDRDAWTRLMLAADVDELTCTAKIVAARIALHLNIERGQCNPSLRDLAAETGMSDRNVRRMLRELEQTGWMRINQSRGGRCTSETYNHNSFEFRVPLTRTELSELNPDTAVRVNEPNPDKNEGVTRTNGASNPDTVVRPYKSESKSEEKSEEIDSPQLDLGDEDSRRHSRSPTYDIDAEFEQFWKQVPRKVAKTGAAKLYRKIIEKREATPEELAAGILKYAAEVANRGERYIAHPSTWLSQGRWSDEPAAPSGGTIDQDGNQVATPPPSNRPLPQWRRESNTERLMRKLQQQGGA